MPDNGAPPDSRANILYADEQAPLTWREAWRVLVKSWPFVSRYRRLVAIKCVLVFVSLTFYLMTPWPLKIVIDNVIDGHPLTGIPAAILTPMVGADRTALLVAVSLFLVLTVILIGMVHGEAQGLGTNVNSGGLDQAGITANDANDGGSLWNGLFGYLESHVTIDLTQRMNQSLRTAIYERFLRSPLALYADQKIGDAVFRVMYDSASIGPVFYRGVLAPIMSVFMFVMAIIVLSIQFSNEPVIIVVAILFLPVVAIGSTLFGRLIRDQSQSMRESGSDVMAAFEERVAQVQLIKAFGQESRETAVVDAASWQSFRSTLRMLAIWFVLVIVLAPVCCVLIGYSLYYLMMQVIAGRMTLGDIVLLASYGSMLANPMGIIGGTWAAIQASVAGLRRVHSVLDNLAEPGSDGSGDGLSTRVNNLAFNGVAVGYGATTVLSGVTISMRSGEMVALAGPSGCGKTTLIHSIPRFIEPSAGTIAFDGIDSRAVAPDTIRARMGFVFQNESLFSTSIEDNIRYGSDSASSADVREAAAMAGAAEFIDRLPDGYSTMLGRRGARLSVGQKQRIAIARALLRRPEIMVLDEPAAPLDPASESDLLKTLAALARDRIVIIVAHRAGTLAACDKVFFIHGKTIGAAGTHAHLLATDRDYQAYLAQTDAEIPA
ncbi:MAG TPA: ABC transporter ATP-binding protein [Candidatus Binatus sp.]|nr:ABC transporter ATP-binding protein [Candidatus Binatus sp.]